jgi:hypothetical protein
MGKVTSFLSGLDTRTKRPTTQLTLWDTLDEMKIDLTKTRITKKASNLKM